MPVREYPSVDYIRQCVRYEDGKLFWLVRPREHFLDEQAWKRWNTSFSGKQAGSQYIDKKAKQTKWIVTINYKHILRHLIVWALHKGEWKFGLDHRNRNGLDDRIENLRIANQVQNLQNSTVRSDNTSGFKGVSWNKRRKKWLAQIVVNKRHLFLGYFVSPEEAHAAYFAAANQHFGDFACSG